MPKWIQGSIRRDLMLVVWGMGFIVLISAFLHVFEPRRIVKWDEVLSEAKAAP